MSIEFEITDKAAIEIKQLVSGGLGISTEPLIKVVIKHDNGNITHEFYDIDLDEHLESDILLKSNGISISVDKVDSSRLHSIKLDLISNELGEKIFYFSKV
jgi:Fe-S cluster assembly iron-binding protein IscA